MKVEALLPFMEESDLRELANKILSGEVKGVSIITLFPFLSQKDIDEVVEAMIEKGEVKPLYGALPFLSDKQVNRIYELKQEGKLKGFKDEALIPFLSSSKIKDIFEELIKSATEQANIAEEVSEKVAEKAEKIAEKVAAKVEKAFANMEDDSE